MATKKPSPKKAAKKKQTSSSTGKKIKINLSPAQLKKAEQCISKSGKVTFKLKEISYVKIPKSISVAVVED